MTMIFNQSIASGAKSGAERERYALRDRAFKLGSAVAKAPTLMGKPVENIAQFGAKTTYYVTAPYDQSGVDFLRSYAPILGGAISAAAGVFSPNTSLFVGVTVNFQAA